MEDYGSVLKSLGYDLTDRGTYWQCAALFRQGDNKTALRIYKDSGVWTDFVENSKSLPFEVLIKRTVGDENIEKYLANLSVTQRTERQLLKEERTFPESCLRKLLPDYSYFESRGISKETQKQYRCGLATGGKLYQRIVFPVVRNDGKIHGFAGRKVLQDNDRPPWLNHGKSAEWLYPYYSVEGVVEQIKEENRVFLIESIGDSLSLYQAGIKNNIVTFTNKINPKLTSKLCSLGADIVLASNNDAGQNRGFDGALTSFLKLMDVIDFEKLWFCPTPKEGSDFNNLSREEIEDWRRGLEFTEESHKNSIKRLIDYAPCAKIATALKPKVKKMEKEWSFRYES